MGSTGGEATNISKLLKLHLTSNIPGLDGAYDADKLRIHIARYLSCADRDLINQLTPDLMAKLIKPAKVVGMPKDTVARFLGNNPNNKNLLDGKGRNAKTFNCRYWAEGVQYDVSTSSLCTGRKCCAGAIRRR